MTLELAKARRLEALENRNADRILVKPVAHYSQVTMPDEGTVADYLIEALRNGADLGALESETGWSRATVLVNLYKVAKKTGIGIRRREDVLRMVLPKGSEPDYENAKVVNIDTKFSNETSGVVIHATAECA